jgi:hypothetical protein
MWATRKIEKSHFELFRCLDLSVLAHQDLLSPLSIQALKRTKTRAKKKKIAIKNKVSNTMPSKAAVVNKKRINSNSAMQNGERSQEKTLERSGKTQEKKIDN